MPTDREKLSFIMATMPPQSGMTQASIENWSLNMPEVSDVLCEPDGLLERSVDIVLPSAVLSPSLV